MNKVYQSDASIRSGFELETIKLALIDEVVRNHIKLKSITNNFLTSFSNIFKRTMGLNDLGISYDALLGFGITIIVNILKWVG